LACEYTGLMLQKRNKSKKRVKEKILYTYLIDLKVRQI